MSESTEKPKRTRQAGGFRVCLQKRIATNGKVSVSLTPISPELKDTQEARRWIREKFDEEDSAVREGQEYAIIQMKQRDIVVRTQKSVRLE